MGQDFTIYNLDKEQLIAPARFNDGQRLREFGSSSCGVLLALAALLAHGNEYGGIHSSHEIIGTWAGDRIAIIGDYADLSSFTDFRQSFRKWTFVLNIYFYSSYMSRHFEAKNVPQIALRFESP